MSAPDWKDVLPVPLAGARLHEAWMTTFEQPDTGLLVEHVLPSLLGASHSIAQDVQERTLFFGELGTSLETLRGRITVISSPPAGEREPSQYPWLWRYVDHFMVGATSRAVQHAKFWAFHWKGDDDDVLELHVSSTNLTTSAFKGQVQAGWHVMLPLGPRVTASARKSWGELVTFLGALGDSAGSAAASRLRRLATLLGRVERPADVTFIASIPGEKSAARQLRQFDPSEVHVLTPTVGDWNDQTLRGWSNDVGVDLERVHLKWISTKHAWAECAGWALSRKALAVLETNGVDVECLPNDARFIEEHRDADPRWSHTKLYLLRSRKKRRLLVTSANWSASAWGAGRTTPRNFELGVLFESEWTDLESIGEPFQPPTSIPFCTERADDELGLTSLEWAEATWDGKRVELRVRSTDASTPIQASIEFTGGFDRRVALVEGAASSPWDDVKHTPLSVRFVQGADVIEVDVHDVRSAAAFATTPLPEVDPSVAAALREAFLLQRYGGPAVDADTITGLEREKPAGVAAPAADYSVQAWLDARAAFDVVDSWCAALDEARADPMMLERVRLDGRELHALFARREGPASGLVVEELGWRLEGER